MKNPLGSNQRNSSVLPKASRSPLLSSTCGTHNSISRTPLRTNTQELQSICQSADSCALAEGMPVRVELGWCQLRADVLPPGVFLHNLPELYLYFVTLQPELPVV